MQNPAFTKLFIVIPAYNEGRTVHLILDKIKQVELRAGIQKEVIVVNDCSKDDTEEAIMRYKANNPELNLCYYKHQVNKGKGAALHTGIRYATGEYVVIQDADLEYNPAEYNILIQPVLDGFADVVFGSRFMGGRPHRILFFWHTIGNKFLTFLFNLCTNLNLTDMETCYKLFNTRTLQSLLMGEKRIGKVLTDTRTMGAISPEDQDWTIQEWLLRAFKVNYRRIAVVISKDIFNQMSVEDIMNRVEGVDFVTKYFPSVEEGKAWLATQ